MALYLISSGTVTAGPTVVKVLRGSVTRTHKVVRNITGAGDAQTGSLYEVGRPIWRVNLQGVWNRTGSTYDLPVVNDKLTGDTLYNTSRVVIAKSQAIMDTTGDDTYADSEFTIGRASYQYSGFGWLSDADTVLGEEDATGTISNKVSSYVVELREANETLTGAIIITSYNVGMPFTAGGPAPVRWQGVGNTDAPTTTTTPWNQTSFTCTLTDIGGVTLTGTVVPDRITCDVDYENAVPTVVNISGVYSGGQIP